MASTISSKKLGVAILANGLGSRIRSITRGSAKTMLKFNGYPFMEYLVGHFIRLGIEEIIIMAGANIDQITETFGSFFYQAMGVKILDDQLGSWNRPLGTGGSVAKILERTEKEIVFICNGDTVLQMDVLSAYAQFLKLNCAMAIPVTFNKGVQNESAILIQEKTDLVVEFFEGRYYQKNKSTEAGFYRASNVGAGFYRKTVQDVFVPGSCLYQDGTHKLVERQEVYALPLKSPHFFWDFGVIKRYWILKKYQKVLHYIYGSPFASP
jgi:D-glycero-alpha-D-manno-heptose 1-phosphate guanylyltransferase